MGIDRISILLICIPTIPWTLPSVRPLFPPSRAHSIPHHRPHLATPLARAHHRPCLILPPTLILLPRTSTSPWHQSTPPSSPMTSFIRHHCIIMTRLWPHDLDFHSGLSRTCFGLIFDAPSHSFPLHVSHSSASLIITPCFTRIIHLSTPTTIFPFLVLVTLFGFDSSHTLIPFYSFSPFSPSHWFRIVPVTSVTVTTTLPI